MIWKKIKKNKGFVILFAVTLSALILSIALGVANIAFKEAKFNTSAKDTDDAFFAADTGAECALNNDKSTANVFKDSGATTINCNGNNISITLIETSLWKFIVPTLSNGGQGCVIVTVDKRSLVEPTTTIISKGYNIGSPSCNSTSSNRVERELDVNY